MPVLVSEWVGLRFGQRGERFLGVVELVSHAALILINLIQFLSFFGRVFRLCTDLPAPVTSPLKFSHLDVLP